MDEKDFEFIIREKDYLITILTWFAVIPPLVIIAGFFFVYNKLQERRIKEVKELQKELTNLKHRSNGVKHEVDG